MEAAKWPLDGSMLGVSALVILSILLVSFLLVSEMKDDDLDGEKRPGLLGGMDSDGVHSPRGVMERCMQRVELVRVAEVGCGA